QTSLHECSRDHWWKKRTVNASLKIRSADIRDGGHTPGARAVASACPKSPSGPAALCLGRGAGVPACRRSRVCQGPARDVAAASSAAACARKPRGTRPFIETSSKRHGAESKHG